MWIRPSRIAVHSSRPLIPTTVTPTTCDTYNPYTIIVCTNTFRPRPPEHNTGTTPQSFTSLKTPLKQYRVRQPCSRRPRLHLVHFNGTNARNYTHGQRHEHENNQFSNTAPTPGTIKGPQPSRHQRQEQHRHTAPRHQRQEHNHNLSFSKVWTSSPFPMSWSPSSLSQSTVFQLVLHTWLPILFNNPVHTGSNQNSPTQTGSHNTLLKRPFYSVA